MICFNISHCDVQTCIIIEILVNIYVDCLKYETDSNIDRITFHCLNSKYRSFKIFKQIFHKITQNIFLVLTDWKMFEGLNGYNIELSYLLSLFHLNHISLVNTIMQRNALFLFSFILNLFCYWTNVLFSFCFVIIKSIKHFLQLCNDAVIPKRKCKVTKNENHIIWINAQIWSKFILLIWDL